MSHESIMTVYLPNYVSFPGTIDDDETLADALYYVSGVKFKDGEPQRVEVRLCEDLFYISPNDKADCLESARRVIKTHRERRLTEDRRQKARQADLERRQQQDRRQH